MFILKMIWESLLIAMAVSAVTIFLLWNAVCLYCVQPFYREKAVKSVKRLSELD